MWSQTLIKLLAFQGWFYYLAKYSVLAYGKLRYNLHVKGEEHVPHKGGVIIAANHISSLDPPFLGAVVPRKVDYMAKKELFSPPFGEMLMRGLHAFPVDRSRADMTAIKEALRRLQQGAAVGIFIQGTRNSGDAEALNGAAFLAQRADVCVIPAAVWRKDGAFYVRFGEAIKAGDRSKETMQALTDATMERINALITKPW